MKSYYIYLTPANKNFKPHRWEEGGLFDSFEDAKPFVNHINQLRQVYDRRKKVYSKVEIKELK